MHGLMFSAPERAVGAKYEEWAKQIGLDVARWRKDKESPEVAALIAKDNSYGSRWARTGRRPSSSTGRFVSGPCRSTPSRE